MLIQYMPRGTKEMVEVVVAEPVHVLTGPANTIRTTVTHEGVIVDLTDEEDNDVLATNGYTFAEFLGRDKED